MTNRRNVGVDALRILAMYGIVIMHILYKGGLLGESTGIENYVLWLIEIICYCAVNCYAMISGYVIYSEEERQYKYARYIKLWIQVFFWSFGITAMIAIFGNCKVELVDLIKSALPVISKTYWYFTAYTLLFFVIPWINKLLRILSEKEITRLVATLFLMFSVVGLITDPFGIDYGYSFTWIAFMYISGAWIKKCNITEKVEKNTALLISLFCVVITWLTFVFSPLRHDVFVKYVSPTMVLYGGCMLIVFSKFKFGKTLTKIISYVSTCTFAVYIIHEHPLIKCNFAEWFGWMTKLNILSEIGCVLLCGAGVFAVCLLFEKCRVLIFNLLKINERIVGLYMKLSKKNHKTLTK